MLETIKSALSEMRKDETGSLSMADAICIPIVLGVLVFGGGGAVFNSVNEYKALDGLINTVDTVNSEYDTWASSNSNASVDVKKNYILSQIQRLPESEKYGVALDESADNICLWNTGVNRAPSNAKAITISSRSANCTKMTVLTAPDGSVKPVSDDADKGSAVLPKTPSTPAPEFPWSMMLGILATTGVALGGGAGVIFSVKKAKAKARTARRNRLNSEAQWNTLIKRHDTIRRSWAAYELDPMKMLDYPVLSDMREQVTANLHLALKKANTLKPESLDAVIEDTAARTEYQEAVIALEHAFEVAESEAKRVQWTKFSVEEQKRLKTAKSLLSFVLDGAASEFERQSAYKQMNKELSGLISIPSATMSALETQMRVMIEAKPVGEKLPA